MQAIYTYLVTSVWLAFRELAHHRNRSFLTMLGILIGIACVIVITSVGEGLNEYFESQLVTQATADMVFIMPDAPIRLGQEQLLAAERPFRPADLEAIRGSEYVQAAYGGSMDYDAVARHGWRSTNLLLLAAPAEFMAVNNMEIDYGRVFNRAEEHSSASVAVIGPDVIEELYEPHEKVLGSTLQVEGHRFTVIGVLEGRSAVENGQEVNLGVFIPLSTGQHRVWGSHDMVWLFAQIRSRDELETAREDIASRLRQTRRIRSGADDDFMISTPAEWAEFASSFVQAMIYVFAVVAVLALLVGTIGVVNVMFVAVKERTREIGLRKAVGATSGHIALQFLIESVALTVSGGALGLAFGWLFSLGLLKLADRIWNVFWTPSIPLGWVVFVLLTSILIGIVAGVIPAWRASRLDPVTAMRYE